MDATTAMTPVPLPKPVRDLLGDLLDRRVEVQVAEAAYAPEPGEPATYAVYVDDAMRTRAVGVADLAFSAFAGAAIGLIPPNGAQVAIEEKSLPAAMQENLYEVLNVLASLFNAEGLPHVKLHAAYSPGGAGAPSDARAYACVLGRRLDLEVEIGGYGSGRFSVVGVG
ncbi:MAG: hypothetical protein ACXVY4_16180 [Oryzihumus sp.]